MSPEFPDARPKVLWVNGPAGYGKTIPCAKVAEYVSSQPDPGHHVAHYFVSAESGADGASSTIIRSWLLQLVSQSSAALNVARELWDPNTSPSASQEEVMRVPNSVLCELDGCTLVADGLDECAWAQDSRAGDQDRGSAMGFFRSLAEIVGQTKTRALLFSRREEDRIKPAFNAQLSCSQSISTAQ
ncbi:hypothetical protein RB597_009400 [Gaeumannomyces tritici]